MDDAKHHPLEGDANLGLAEESCGTEQRLDASAVCHGERTEPDTCDALDEDGGRRTHGPRVPCSAGRLGAGHGAASRTMRSMSPV